MNGQYGPRARNFGEWVRNSIVSERRLFGVV